MLHGGATKHAQRKAQERLNFAKAIMLERAVRGIVTDPSMSPADKRLAKAVARQQGKPGPRRATRAAGPPSPPKAAPMAQPAEAPPQEHAEAHPERAPKRAEPPSWGLPAEAGPRNALTTAEDALADVARANRRAGVLSQRRRRRR